MKSDIKVKCACDLVKSFKTKDSSYKPYSITMDTDEVEGTCNYSFLEKTGMFAFAVIMVVLAGLAIISLF